MHWLSRLLYGAHQSFAHPGLVSKHPRAADNDPAAAAAVVATSTVLDGAGGLRGALALGLRWVAGIINTAFKGLIDRTRKTRLAV